MFFKVLLFLLLSLSLYVADKRISRETEERLAKVSETTKRMIQALAASGHPKSAIAERIKNERVNRGSKAAAERLVDAVIEKSQKTSSRKSAPAGNKRK
jgi:hypothetical protein